jgi:hypothetical protein
MNDPHLTHTANQIFSPPDTIYFKWPRKEFIAVQLIYVET